MKQVIILFTLLMFGSYIQAQEGNSKVNYNVVYIFDEKGDIYRSEANLQFALGNLYVHRNNYTKNWKCDYKGIIKKDDNKASFYYHHYYLPTKNIHMYISKIKEVKHEGIFYYRVIFDGQTQLAL